MSLLIHLISLPAFLSQQSPISASLFFVPQNETVINREGANGQPKPITPDRYIGFQSNHLLYFENLYTFSAENSYGSCGYVSLLQYMSYYDTFWNDNIIPEVYDYAITDATSYSQAISTSPGVKKQSYPSPGMALYLFCVQTESNNFQSRCMRIHNSAMGTPDYLFSQKIHMVDYQAIFDSLYGSGAVSFTYNSYLFYSGSPLSTQFQSSITNYVLSFLASDKPVILHIATGYSVDNNGVVSVENYHSVVAYDYANGSIYCNFGWGAEHAHLPLTGYYILDAGVADFESLPHVHSDNYTLNGFHYCGCGFHAHIYEDHYVSMNPYYHYAYCQCGAYTVYSHALVPNENGGGYHCRNCNYAT